jgi:hypothetical protein
VIREERADGLGLTAEYRYTPPPIMFRITMEPLVDELDNLERQMWFEHELDRRLRELSGEAMEPSPSVLEPCDSTERMQ